MTRIVLVAVTAALLPFAARADRCAQLAKPKVFNKASAMLAIFCEYDAEHDGTLIPVRFTKDWQTRGARVLATPLLVATYHERGIRKGVLAVQRQDLDEDGEPIMGHAVSATISIYVFREQEESFVFEKGARNATATGAHGTAPGGRLMRLGTDRTGIWFEGGDVHQGYTNDYALVFSLSDPSIVHLGTFDTGQSNSGACPEAPWGHEDCWGYEGHPELVPVPGDPFAILRIRYEGTEKPESSDRITSKNVNVCYARRGDRYEVLDTPFCNQRQAGPEFPVFGVEESAERAAPGLSVPRKLLK
jgi:hypothetical protein